MIKVRVLTVFMRDYAKYHGRVGVVIEKRTPFRTGHPEDLCMPAEYKVRISESTVISLPEDCCTPVRDQ